MRWSFLRVMFGMKTLLKDWQVGDERGAILDGVIDRVAPKRVLELGAYGGYSALRIARRLPPGGHLYSVEFNATNAALARAILTHAGIADRVTIVVGYLGDDGKTMRALTEQHGSGGGNLDVACVTRRSATRQTVTDCGDLPSHARAR
jgi:catechol O-methyltransferase